MILNLASLKGYRKEVLRILIEATFAQNTRIQRFLKNIQTLSYWYSLDSSYGALSYKYQCARVSVIFQIFCIYVKLATTGQHKG